MRSTCLRVLILCLALTAAALAVVGPPASAAGGEGLSDAEVIRLRAVARDLFLKGRRVGDLEVKRLTPVFPDEDGRWRFTSEEGHYVFVSIMCPPGRGRRPALLLHPHFGASKYAPSVRLLQKQLVAKGFLVAVIDSRYKGERAQSVGKRMGRAIAGVLADPSSRARPFLIDTVFDLHRTIDFLVSTPGVAKRIRFDEVEGERSYRIGALGTSTGGVVAWLLASFDTRVQAVAPIIAVTEFQKVLRVEDADTYPQASYARQMASAIHGFAAEHCDGNVDADCMRKVWRALMPEMVDNADFATAGLLQCIAPRPLLIISHDNDDFFPLPGVRAVTAEVRLRYQRVAPADHLERFQYREFEGVHGVYRPTGVSDLLRTFKSVQRIRRNVDIAGRFLKRWLGKKRASVEPVGQ